MPHKSVSLTILLLTALLSVSCVERTAPLSRELAELEGYIAARPVYETRKKDQLEGIRKMAESTTNRRRLFDYGMYAANEYFSYSFDSTAFYLKKCLDLAGELQDTDRYNQASILLGHLYAKAGSYMEAYTILYEQLDSVRLSRALLPVWKVFS